MPQFRTIGEFELPLGNVAPAQIYAKVWDIKIEDAKALLPKYFAWNHWSKGDFSKKGLDAVLDGMRATGELEGDFDWSKLIDQRFLRDDLKRQL